MYLIFELLHLRCSHSYWVGSKGHSSQQILCRQTWLAEERILRGSEPRGDHSEDDGGHARGHAEEGRSGAGGEHSRCGRVGWLLEELGRQKDNHGAVLFGQGLRGRCQEGQCARRRCWGRSSVDGRQVTLYSIQAAKRDHDSEVLQSIVWQASQEIHFVWAQLLGEGVFCFGEIFFFLDFLS